MDSVVHQQVGGRVESARRGPVLTEPRVKKVAGAQEVNSHHHQGAATVGQGGRVTARSIPDGVIEAIEWPERRFALGVQWHPEDPPIESIFTEFVAAASQLSTCAARST